MNVEVAAAVTGEKRTADQAELKAPATEVAKPEGSDAKPAAEEPDAKRIKATPVDIAVLRKQVEYYFSDQNLMYDKFFHEKISSDPDGWLAMSLILSCNKMKAMRATKETVCEALKGSMLEIREGEGDVVPAVRRPQVEGKTKLPELQEKSNASPYQKKKPHAHDGGVIVIVKDVPEEQTWMQVKDALRTKLPEKTGIMYASTVSDKNHCVVAVTPFEGDMQLLGDLKLEVGGAMLKTEICYGDLLQQALKLMPKNVRERREKMARTRQKERQKPIVLANQRFPNAGAVRGRIKTILSSRSDGEVLNQEGSDYKLIHAVLQFHPRAADKCKGMTGIKIDQSAQGTNRCFWIVRGDTSEDFSANKCLNAMELDPPYAQDTPAKGGDDKEAPSPAAATKEDAESPKAATPEAAKVEDAKAVEAK